VKNYTIWDFGNAFFRGARLTGIPSNELVLNPNSTYKKTTCGNIFDGTWTVAHDSLILHRRTMWYRNAKWQIEHQDPNYDSIAGYHRPFNVIFLIKHNKLINYSHAKTFTIQPDGTKKYKNFYSVEILK